MFRPKWFSPKDVSFSFSKAIVRCIPKFKKTDAINGTSFSAFLFRLNVEKNAAQAKELD